MQYFLDILDERLDFYEGGLTEAVYLREVNEFLKKFGTFEDNKYIPNNPQQVLGVMIDHMTLIKATNGRSKRMKLMQFQETLYYLEIKLR